MQVNSFVLSDWMTPRLRQIELALQDWIDSEAPAGLGQAMRYAVLDGGKRLRPLLVLAAAEAVGLQDVAPGAAALRAAAWGRGQ